MCSDSHKFRFRGVITMRSLKKLCFILVIVSVMSLCSVYSFAASYSRNVDTTGQFIVDIYRPYTNDSSSSKSFIISGNTNEDNVKVELFILDRDEDRYVPFANVNGQTSWGIGSSGYFSKEVELWYRGENKLLIVAYRTTNSGIRQVNKFTVTVVNDNLTDVVKDLLSKFSGLFK